MELRSIDLQQGAIPDSTTFISESDHIMNVLFGG
jgi:hypothetical protein